MNSSLTRSTIVLAICAALPLSYGCSHDEVAPAGATNTTSVPVVMLAPASPGKAGSNVYLSDRLRSECQRGGRAEVRVRQEPHSPR
jgi:hypothetical protein